MANPETNTIPDDVRALAEAAIAQAFTCVLREFEKDDDLKGRAKVHRALDLMARAASTAKNGLADYYNVIRLMDARCYGAESLDSRTQYRIACCDVLIDAVQTLDGGRRA